MSSSSTEFNFQYTRFDGEFFACGNIGYDDLKICGIDDSFRAALSEAYWRYTRYERPLFRLESEEPEELSQVNGVVALIYNFDFDGPLGLKLNENWESEGAGRYGGLFQTAQPVVADWKLGPKFPPLRIDQSLEPLRHLHSGDGVYRTMELQLTASARNLKFVLVGFPSPERSAVRQVCPDLQRIFDREEDAEYIVAHANGLTVFHCQGDGDWEKEEISVPLPRGASWIPKTK